VILTHNGNRSSRLPQADFPRLKREAKQFGKINIQDGTKGGQPMPANAMSKSPTIHPAPSTVAIAINSTDA
jgi:hypothetical protein